MNSLNSPYRGIISTVTIATRLIPRGRGRTFGFGPGWSACYWPAAPDPPTLLQVASVQLGHTSTPDRVASFKVWTFGVWTGSILQNISRPHQSFAFLVFVSGHVQRHEWVTRGGQIQVPMVNRSPDWKSGDYGEQPRADSTEAKKHCRAHTSQIKQHSIPLHEYYGGRYQFGCVWGYFSKPKIQKQKHSNPAKRPPPRLRLMPGDNILKNNAKNTKKTFKSPQKATAKASPDAGGQYFEEKRQKY